MSCPIYPMSVQASPQDRLDLAVDMARSGYGYEDISITTGIGFKASWRLVQSWSGVRHAPIRQRRRA